MTRDCNQTCHESDILPSDRRLDAWMLSLRPFMSNLRYQGQQSSQSEGPTLKGWLTDGTFCMVQIAEILLSLIWILAISRTSLL